MKLVPLSLLQLQLQRTNITVIVKAPTFIIIITNTIIIIIIVVVVVVIISHLLISPVIISVDFSRCRRCMTWSLASHSLTSLAPQDFDFTRRVRLVSTFSNWRN